MNKDFNFCPKCGTERTDGQKFCPNCGYSYENPQPEKQPSKVKETFKKIWKWVKLHLKIVIPVVVALVLVIVLSCTIPACIANKTNGTYYKLSYSGELDKKTYFILKSGSWTDEDGETGTYKKNGDKIVFYYTLFGETDELCDGTLKNYVLTVNGDTYVSEKHKHNYGEWKTLNEATCTTNGLSSRECLCGFKESADITALGHSFNWVIKKQATCLQEGSKAYTCSKCSYVEETQVIELLEHSFNDYVYDRESHWKVCTAGCKQKFYSEAHKGTTDCSVCKYHSNDTIELSFYLFQDKRGYQVTGIGSATCTDIRIPQCYDGLPVISISDLAFSNCSELTSIIIPDSVTEIGKHAFFGCSGLSSITIPDSVTEIGQFAFRNCSQLTSITIPNGVTKISYGAFSGCSGLTSITIPNSVTKISDDAFSGCSGLTSITIPDSVTKIEQYAFKNCSQLTSITIKNSLDITNYNMFNGCSNLTDVYYTGTKKQYKNANHADFDEETVNYTVHCSDGDIKKGQFLK